MVFSAHAMRLDAYLSASDISLDPLQLRAVDAGISHQLSVPRLDTLKKATHHLRSLLAELGHPVKQSFAFEALARYLGYQNWNCARSAASFAPEYPPRNNTVAPTGWLCLEILEKEAGVARLSRGLQQLPSLIQGNFRLRIISRPSRDVAPLNEWRTQNLMQHPLLQGITDSRRSWLTGAIRQSRPLFGLAQGVYAVRHFLVLELLAHACVPDAKSFGALRDSLSGALGCSLAFAEATAVGSLISIGPLPVGFKPWSGSTQGQLQFDEPATTVFDFESAEGALTLLRYGACIEPSAHHPSPHLEDRGATSLSPTDLAATLGACSLNDGVLAGQTQGIPLATRVGNLNVLDLWSRDTEGQRSSAFVLSAISGSGKSFVADDIVTDALSRRKNVRIVDHGRTHTRLGAMFGAEGLVLNLDTPVSLNLFSGVQDESLLTAVLPLWVATLTELFRLQQIESAGLQQVLVSAWGKYREKLNVSTLVATLLSSSDIELVRLGATMQAFYLKNQAWLDGPSVVLSGEKRFVVVETEGLTPDELLGPALRQLLIANLAQEALTNTTETLYLVDESWYILDGMSRTFAKEILRCMEIGAHLFGSIIQSIQNESYLPFVQEMLERADYLLLMRQRRDCLEKFYASSYPFGDMLRKHAGTEWSTPGQSNSVLGELCSVHSGQGFSEMAVLTRDKYLGVYRFATDRTTYYTYTTNQRDWAQYKEFLTQGHTPGQAIQAQVARELAQRHA